jgi:hypothetical protein
MNDNEIDPVTASTPTPGPKKFPLLSQVTKRIFCVQRANTASERDFSASGYTVWDRRNALLKCGNRSLFLN